MRRRVTSSDLPRHLREARRRAGLTLSALAERTGVSLSSLSRFESGASHPGFEDVCTIARVLNVPLLFLAEGRYHTGTDPRDLIAHLAYWGLDDLVGNDTPLLGESRGFEELIAEATGNGTTPRIIEGIPALLLKNDFSPDALASHATRTDTLVRVGWLAEMAEWIATQLAVSDIRPSATTRLREIKTIAWSELKQMREQPAPAHVQECFDGLGTTDAVAPKNVPPIARKWRIAYTTPQNEFLQRARSILRVEGKR